MSKLPRAQHHRFGVSYYKTWEKAEKVLAHVQPSHPEARIAEYGLGFAVQFYKSGPYWPDNAPRWRSKGVTP